MTQSAITVRSNDDAGRWLPLNADISASPPTQKAFSTDAAYDILAFAIESKEAGLQVALCTLVDIRGGSSRALGAHMVVAEDGRYCGYVSGGCTEAAIAAEALETIRSGHDRFFMLGEGSRVFDIVFPCGGGITVAIHIVKNIEPLRSIISLVDRRQSAWLHYVPRHEQLSVTTEHCRTGWDGDAFVTCYRPSVRVILSGHTLEVETAASVAKAAGYDVIFFDDAASLPPDRALIDPHSAVALLQHDLDREMPVLEAALAASPFYIGALGSSRTHQKRVEQLLQGGHSAEVIARIKAPIGIFDGARDAQSLALSVIADIAATRQSLSTHN